MVLSKSEWIGPEAQAVVDRLRTKSDRDMVSAEREIQLIEDAKDMKFVLADGLTNFVVRSRAERKTKAVSKFSSLLGFRTEGAKN